MQNRINQLQIWQKKDLISQQIEEISESSDWYRGGRKIGKLRREYKTIERAEAKIETFFDERIMVAHQTYMDRLALHKLKGPTNQEALKKDQIKRTQKQSALFLQAIHLSQQIISDLQSSLSIKMGDKEPLIKRQRIY